MLYQLTPVPYSIGATDNFLVKTDKSSTLHYMTRYIADAHIPNADETLTIIDGNATFHEMQQVSYNFLQICDISNMIPHTSDIVFSTDMYREHLVKSMWRKQRSCAEKIIHKEKIHQKTCRLEVLSL
jgi:hypothetical protein